MRQTSPGRRELGPGRNQEQHRQLLDAPDRKLQQFQARGIDPVHVFEDRQDGASCG